MEQNLLREKYGKNLTPQQQEHVESIIARCSEWIYSKYAMGQQEHGGDLWRKDIMPKAILEEAIDLVVYGFTLLDQLREKGIELGEELPD